MPRGFGRLPFLTRRSDRTDRSDRDAAPVGRRQLDADSAAVGPPALLPSMIYREILFDASEMTPVWARPRDAATVPAPRTAPTDRPSAPAAPEAAVKPKRPRRPRTTSPSVPTSKAEPPDKPKRTRKARPASC